MTTPMIAPVHSQADLQALWSRLMGEGGFSERCVWMMALVDDVPIPALTQIGEADALPTTEQAAGFVRMLRHLREEEKGEGLRFAFLYSRPGSARVLDEDRGWARFLLHSCHEAGVGVHPVHLATRHGVLPVAPDDLVVPVGAG